MKSWTAAAAIVLCLGNTWGAPRAPAGAAAETELDPVTQFSLDEYVERAIETGISGRKNSLSLETAGYSREVVFRQTQAPSMTATETIGRQGTTTDGVSTLEEGQRSLGLEVDEQTPLGTTLKANGAYGDTYGTSDGAAIASNGQKPQFSLNATQPLYLFVKNPVARRRRLADLSFSDAQNSFESERLTIRTQARANYYTVLQNDEAIQVARRKADSSHKLLDVTQALVDAGKSAPVDAMRAKITLQTDLRALDNAVTSRDQAVLNAKNFIYFPLDQDLEFTSRLAFKPFRVSLDKLVNYALLHQPNLQILRRQQEEAFLNWQAALEPTRPTISLNGTYNYTETPLGIYPVINPVTTNGLPTLFTVTSYTRGWSWTLNASWMFFDSGVTRDQIKQAQIARTVADLNLADGERTAQVNVRNAYMDVQRTQKQIEDFQSQREQARRNVDVLRLRFQNGLATLIDVVDAENDMRDLDTEYLTLLVQFNESKDTLTEQVGKDVDTL